MCVPGADFFCSRRELEVLPGVVPSVTIVNLDGGHAMYFPNMLAFYGGFHHYGVNAKKPQGDENTGCIQLSQTLGGAEWLSAQKSLLVASTSTASSVTCENARGAACSDTRPQPPQPPVSVRSPCQENYPADAHPSVHKSVLESANPAWTRSVYLDAPGQWHGQQPVSVSGTAEPPE